MAVLILCLLLPLHGFAALQFVAQPCPMQQMMAMEDVDSAVADALAQAMKGCCNDLASFERTGQPCKSAQSCTAPAAWMPPFQPVAFEARASHDLRASVWRSLPPGAASRLWRPPASV